MERHAFNPTSLPTPPGYSQIVQVTGGDTLFIAGQVSLDASGELVGAGDLEAQARQVFANLVTALAECGASPSDLVKIGIYVVGLDEEKLGLIRRVRDDTLPADPPPASTLIGVERLALPQFLVEVDGIAVVAGSSGVV